MFRPASINSMLARYGNSSGKSSAPSLSSTSATGQLGRLVVAKLKGVPNLVLADCAADAPGQVED